MTAILFITAPIAIVVFLILALEFIEKLKYADEDWDVDDDFY